MLVALCVPTTKKPYQQTLDSIAASLPMLDEAGIEHCMVSEVGCPYISHARSTMLRKALDAKADVIVFIDHDLSWEPEDLLKLIQTEGDVIAGTYRFKKDPEEYMGQLITHPDGTPIVREDGCLKTHSAPAGFLKLTRNAVNRFAKRYPELLYGDRMSPGLDLFNHGAYEGVWYGEDYAFCRRWLAIDSLWTIPNLNLTHHTQEQAYPGNLHRFLLHQPGGSEA